MRKAVTIKHVARAAGVSPMTVSRVLNNRPDVSPQTRKRVQDVINQLGYSPSAIARNLSQGRSSTIGVVSAGLGFFGPSRTLVGIERQANELGYSLMVRLLHDPLVNRGEQALGELIANQVAGIIWAVTEMGDQHEWLRQESDNIATPIVFLGMERRPNLSLVTVDQREGGRLAARHLLAYGYQKLGIITGPPQWWEARQRELGWNDVLGEAGIPVLEDLKDQGDWSAASGYAAMCRLLGRAPDLEAVFVCNDSMATGALRAAAEVGRCVPRDLAIVGFDDIPESAYFSPPLTTVRQDLLEVGCRAVNLLTDQLVTLRNDEPVTAQASFIEPKLIVRQSSFQESR
jgi:LacI family transcriptional regulator